MKVVITQDNGESLMLVALELQTRHKQDKVWSIATWLVTVQQAPDGSAIPGLDCDILTDIIKVPHGQIDLIVSDRWSDTGAQGHSSNRRSMEHAVNHFSILLTKSMDKQLQWAVEQDSV